MALDKFIFKNVLAPNAGLEVVGFGRDSLGLFQIIALQPLIQGSELTEEDRLSEEEEAVDNRIE